MFLRRLLKEKDVLYDVSSTSEHIIQHKTTPPLVNPSALLASKLQTMYHPLHSWHKRQKKWCGSSLPTSTVFFIVKFASLKTRLSPVLFYNTYYNIHTSKTSSTLVTRIKRICCFTAGIITFISFLVDSFLLGFSK